MPKKSRNWVGIEIISYVKLVGFAFVSFILIASCNNGGNKSTNGDTTSATATTETTPTPKTPVHRQNWLEDVPRNRWDTIPFRATDSAQIENEKRRIQSYVWDSLSAYNARIRAIN